MRTDVWAPKTEKTCGHCGTTFMPKSGRQDYCTPTCMQKAKWLRHAERNGIVSQTERQAATAVRREAERVLKAEARRVRQEERAAAKAKAEEEYRRTHAVRGTPEFREAISRGQRARFDAMTDEQRFALTIEGGRKHTPEEVRFWQLVEKTDDCWEWRGYAEREGYGQFASREYSTTRAHRIAWFLTYGDELSPDVVLHHECGNPGCVKPDHLTAMSADEHDDLHKARWDARKAVA